MCATNLTVVCIGTLTTNNNVLIVSSHGFLSVNTQLLNFTLIKDTVASIYALYKRGRIYYARYLELGSQISTWVYFKMSNKLLINLCFGCFLVGF